MHSNRQIVDDYKASVLQRRHIAALTFSPRHTKSRQEVFVGHTASLGDMTPIAMKLIFHLGRELTFLFPPPADPYDRSHPLSDPSDHRLDHTDDSSSDDEYLGECENIGPWLGRAVPPLNLRRRYHRRFHPQEDSMDEPNHLYRNLRSEIWINHFPGLPLYENFKRFLTSSRS